MRIGIAPPRHLSERKALREKLRPYAVPSTVIGIMLAAGDFLLYMFACATIVLVPALAIKVVFSFIAGIAICRLFVLGHDAGHHCLTSSRVLNAALGRLLMLPSLTPFSLWVAGHNVGHHGFAGFREKDLAWIPLSPQSYYALPLGKRLAYQVFRSPFGAGIYYGYEIWWKKLYFPGGKNRREFIVDCWMVTGFLAAEVAILQWAAFSTQQSPLTLLALVVVLPFVVWTQLAGIVFFLHHTNEQTKWYDDAREWRASYSDVENTATTQLPLRLDRLLHNAMDHTGHHINPSIPCYRLHEARNFLIRERPDLVIRTISIRRYLEIVKRCKLYDSHRHVWLQFEGKAQRARPNRSNQGAD